MKCLIGIFLSLMFSSSLLGITIPPKKKLNRSDLEKIDISTLWLMKNSIYAKQGRPFKNYELNGYFSRQKWYKRKENYKDNLSKIDVHNIDIINEYENELKKNDIIEKDGNIELSFENIYNTFQYPHFNANDKKSISKNGFVVYPSDKDQLYHIYEDNDYKGIPSFVSTDLVLQLYHMYFDMTLRKIETQYFTNTLDTLLTNLIIQFNSIKTNNSAIRSAVNFNLEYLAIAKTLLTDAQQKLPDSLQNIVDEELDKIAKHDGYFYSNLLKKEFDYSQFIVRGHYTRNRALRNYFLSMMWIGNVGISIEKGSDTNIGVLSRNIEESDIKINLLSSMLFAHVLNNSDYNGRKLLEYWKDIYEPTVFYVGISDDLSPNEVYDQMVKTFPIVSNIDSYNTDDKLLVLQKNLCKIQSQKQSIDSAAFQETQFRLMGQRFIPDSYIFQRLTKYPERTFPNSLDVMAAFGSKKARQILDNDYKTNWDEYSVSLNELTKTFSVTKESEWKKNLYYYWLYSLKALFELTQDKKALASLPFFMTTEAWERKTLNTCLGSWAELRHNTILYAKQSEIVECGGDSQTEKVWIPEPPKGYVEPNTEFYERIIDILKLTENGLRERGMSDEYLLSINKQFQEIVLFLLDVSKKELKKQELSLEEYEQIQKIGSLFENLTEQTVGLNAVEPSESELSKDDESIDGEIVEEENLEEDYESSLTSEPDKNMAVIADIHGTSYHVLEVGVGKADEIFVVVEIEGKLKLMRGAIFSFYEFQWPKSDRLTDEKWQKMLEESRAPRQPKWINYHSKQKMGPNIEPLYQPSHNNKSSSQPGWQEVTYDTGC